MKYVGVSHLSTAVAAMVSGQPPGSLHATSAFWLPLCSSTVAKHTPGATAADIGSVNGQLHHDGMQGRNAVLCDCRFVAAVVFVATATVQLTKVQDGCTSTVRATTTLLLVQQC